MVGIVGVHLQTDGRSYEPRDQCLNYWSPVCGSEVEVSPPDDGCAVLGVDDDGDEFVEPVDEIVVALGAFVAVVESAAVDGIAVLDSESSQ